VILWQNLGVSRQVRYFRTGLIAVATIIILAICCMIQLYGSTADKEVQKYSPQVECDKDLVPFPDEAVTDFKLGDEQNGLMFCFCKDQFDNHDKTGSYEFEDGEQYCQEWVQRYVLTNTLVYGVPLLVSTLNFVAKYILRFLTMKQGC